MNCKCRGVCRCNKGIPLIIHQGTDQRIPIDCGKALNGCCIEPEFVIDALVLIWCKCCNCEIDSLGFQFFDFNHRERCFLLIGEERTKYLPTGTFRYQITVQTEKEKIVSQHGAVIIQGQGSS